MVRGEMVVYRISVIEKGALQRACGGIIPPTLTRLADSTDRGNADNGSAGGYCHERRTRGFGYGTHALRSKAKIRSVRRLEVIIPQDTENKNVPKTNETKEGEGKETWPSATRIEQQPTSAQAAGCKETSTPKNGGSLVFCKSIRNQNGCVASSQSGAASPFYLQMAELPIFR